MKIGVKITFCFQKGLARCRGELLAAREDFRGRFALQRELGQFARLVHFEPADDVFDRRDAGRRGAQFIHAQADQQRREHGVAGDFAADAGPDAVLVRGIHGHLDQPQDGRMRRFVKVRDFFVRAVGGQRVLDQVVGADAEKFHPLAPARRR